ncbi:MAG: membrane protein insertase YidC [Crocinitomicaceae bacterium]
MDKNTVIGLVIIGVILSVFTIFNQPSEEELKEKQAKQELSEKRQKANELAVASDEKGTKDSTSMHETATSSLAAKLGEDGKQLVAENGDLIYIDTISKKEISVTPDPTKETAVQVAIEGEIIRMENEKLIIDFDTKGGQISSVLLKEFQTYKNYAKKYNAKKSTEVENPLVLFKKGDATNHLVIPMDGKELNTSNELFTVKSKSNDRIVFQLKKEGNQTIEFIYQFNKDAYDIDYSINIKGFAGKVTPQNVVLNWKASMRKTERLFTEQRRVSTVCFKYQEEGFSWLSEMGDDEEEAEDKVEWVNFKQGYFSSFLRPENGFSKTGSSFKINTYEDGDDKNWSHIKDFSTSMNLNLKSVDNESVKMNWFFGPNDDKVLSSYDSEYEDVLNYGWGLFRWINIYAVQPVFQFLSSTGMGLGIAILLLTFIIKFALMPIQWKMYTSSAKMRILKPEIEEITAKFPDKADAMKKQMETMSLYKESGASPLAGCVPMLIQMPILLAVFRFFPSTFSLRQESFLWAEDLSSFDSIYDFGFNIWMYGDHISLFTLLMAGTTLVYTHINSGNMQTPQQPGMPNMKVIMYFFPIMMIFFFNNYSSGLSYYYFISTLISILIMIMIKKFFVDEEKLKLKMANRKEASATSTKKKGKSKFQERLEQMQKAQQEQLKNKKK